jgi:hypothetical protein
MRVVAALMILTPPWLARGVHAQVAEPVLHAGDVIRIAAPQLGVRRSSGTLIDIRADTLVLSVRGLIPAPGEQFRLSLVEQLDVSVGRNSYAGYGAVIGAILGGLAGGFLLKEDCESAQEGMGCGSFPTTGVVGAGVGGLAGWLAGRLIRPHRWVSVALTPYAVGLVAHSP